MNRLNHVQSVFAHPPPSPALTHSHTLPLSPSPSLLRLTASSYHSLSRSPISAAVFSFSLVFPLHLPLYPLHTRVLSTGERLSLSLFPSPAVSCSSRPSHPITFLSLSPLFTQSLHTATLTWSSFCLSLSISLVVQSPSELTCHSVIVLCHLWY